MTDIDDLMSRPLPLAATDVDAIIAYHRVQRARRAAGEKTEKPKVDLGGVMSRLRPAPAANFKPIIRKI